MKKIGQRVYKILRTDEGDILLIFGNINTEDVSGYSARIEDILTQDANVVSQIPESAIIVKDLDAFTMEKIVNI